MHTANRVDPQNTRGAPVNREDKANNPTERNDWMT